MEELAVLQNLTSFNIFVKKIKERNSGLWNLVIRLVFGIIYKQEINLILIFKKELG